MKFENLRKDMITAMKARDSVRKEVVSELISAVKKVAIDEGTRDEISDELVDRVILKELKTTQEQVNTCPSDRIDIKEEYETKLNIIKEYAPSLMSEAEIKAVITEKFADVLATKNKGLVMKSVMGELKGKADGSLINAVVAELCK